MCTRNTIRKKHKLTNAVPTFLNWKKNKALQMNRWTMMNVNFFRTVSKNINRWFDLIDETQLYIVANSDLTMDYPKPLFPNVISVEELSAEDAKPLSEGKYIKGTPLCSMI